VISQLPEESPPKQPGKRRQPFNLSANQLMEEFDDSPHLTPKRSAGSMELKTCCRDYLKLTEQYELLKKKYEQRGRQMEEI
jgi:hypothetical protein